MKKDPYLTVLDVVTIARMYPGSVKLVYKWICGQTDRSYL